jgi:hypothetical protein
LSSDLFLADRMMNIRSAHEAQPFFGFNINEA